MAKTVTKITSALLIGSILGVGGLALPDRHWPDGSGLDQKDKKKEKEKEPIPEKQKSRGDRGGKGDDKDGKKKGKNS